MGRLKGPRSLILKPNRPLIIGFLKNSIDFFSLTSNSHERRRRHFFKSFTHSLFVTEYPRTFAWTDGPVNRSKLTLHAGWPIV